MQQSRVSQLRCRFSVFPSRTAHVTHGTVHEGRWWRDEREAESIIERPIRLVRAVDDHDETRRRTATRRVLPEPLNPFVCAEAFSYCCPILSHQTQPNG